MKINAIQLRWDNLRGEGCVKTLPYFESAHWVTKLDLLQDCIHDLQNLYDSLLAKEPNADH